MSFFDAERCDRFFVHPVLIWPENMYFIIILAFYRPEDRAFSHTRFARNRKLVRFLTLLRATNQTKGCK